MYDDSAAQPLDPGAEAEAESVPARTFVEKLVELQQMHDAGDLNDDEFAAAKAAILEDPGS